MKKSILAISSLIAIAVFVSVQSGLKPGQPSLACGGDTNNVAGAFACGGDTNNVNCLLACGGDTNNVPSAVACGGDTNNVVALLLAQR